MPSIIDVQYFVHIKQAYINFINLLKSMVDDSLQLLPLNQWHILQTVFKSDWPRCIPGFKALETEEYIINLGFDYGFKVYCPFGNAHNGMVAINKRNTYNEIIIMCPKDDTKELEEALLTTKIIDWTNKLHVPFAAHHIIECVKRIAFHKSLKTSYMITTETFILDTSSLFDVRLPPGYSFQFLSQKHVQLVDSKWPHRYSGSVWYHELLTKAKLGYGLFKENELVSWIYIRETGALGHLYTLEDYRRKGYGELVLMLISNILIQQRKLAVAFCVLGNSSARRLYVKLGFRSTENVDWCGFSNK